MAKLNKRQLESVARRVRKELESFRTIGEGTRRYHEWSMPKDLGGYCMYGSIMVWQALTKLGRRPQIISGSGHWFTHCDGYLIDVTASQFGQADIEVRRLTSMGTPKNFSENVNFWFPFNRWRSIKGVGSTFKVYHRKIKEARRSLQGKK